jgi:ATP-dependent DNA helicase RecQ
MKRLKKILIWKIQNKSRAGKTFIRQDTLAIMPTGGGKSICFQLPGNTIFRNNIVISPLIALMKDRWTVC